VTPTWTTAPPTVPGFYWWRSTGVLGVVEVENLGSYLAVDDPDLGFQPVTDMGGQWAGPLTPAAEEAAP
jgi:hypothetical protein